MSSKPHATPLLSDEWLQILVSELDNESIIGIILGGSHVRGEATPYSDVDIACFVPDSMMPPRKRFIYRDGHLVSLGAKTAAVQAAVDAERWIRLDRHPMIECIANETKQLVFVNWVG